ncbi:MAG: hypothetical protein NTY33_00375 [Candidatus Moranbacteria bacterium]|nr:hypothetical protein [Candidatus Moranbacteria bacterium]
MDKSLKKFAFWGSNNAPRIRSFQSFEEKTDNKGAGKALAGKRYQDIAASFSCNDGCHCTP